MFPYLQGAKLIRFLEISKFFLRKGAFFVIFLCTFALEMNKQGIKNIIFDFGCVLVNLDKHRCIEAFNAINASEVSVYVDEARQEDLFLQLELGTISISEFCDEVRRQSPRCVATDDEIVAAWASLLVDVPLRRLHRILDLKSRYRIFLLSNTNAIHWDMAENIFFSQEGHCVSDFFEKTYLSYKMHLTKPSEEIFQQALRDADILPQETLFIDDSAANCAAAERLGIRVMKVDNGDFDLDL